MTRMNHDHAFTLGEPAREVALCFPAQGTWSEEEYLALDAKRLVEFDNGYIEVLPTPSRSHKLLVLLFVSMFKAFLKRAFPVALVMSAPHPVAGKFREPDAFVLLPDHIHRSHETYCEQPDLVVEIVCPDHRAHDWEVKRREYA